MTGAGSDEVVAPRAATPGSQRILEVAAALFVECGYENTSLRQLASLVGMKAGSLYYHFESKEQLLSTVLGQGIDVMHRAFDEAATRAASAEPMTRVEAHVRAHMATLFEHGHFTAAHVVTFRTAPTPVRDAIIPQRDRYEARWGELLAELAAAGAIGADADLRIARLSLFGAMNATLDWFDPHVGALDELAATIARQWWSGVAA